jgi:L-2-hydroxyglutarate oxidase LhgO
VSERFDLAIVGGGILGLATALRLLETRPDLRVAVIEKEADLGLHQTGRNSGVIHAGLYYAPGSSKARLCRSGKAALERSCEEHDVPFERCGKLVVALDRSELGRLTHLSERGTANGIRGLGELEPAAFREIEPHAAGIRALHVAETGIVDFGRVARAYADEIRMRGATIALGRRVTAIRSGPREVALETTRGPVLTSHLIACAGLQSDRLAAMTGETSGARIVPFRGDFAVLRPAARGLVRGLIYPIPDPGFPFLGVHLTRRINGEVWAGPNAVLAFARERYGRFAVDGRDLAETLRYPGFRRLARRHWRAGLGELGRDWWRPAFVRACQRLVPDLDPNDVGWGPSGIRAQAVFPDGSLADDFDLGHGERVLHVRNAPSPGATASLAIGGMLPEQALSRFGQL